MKFFLRGILALGLPAILAAIASAQAPAPAAGPVAASGGCSSCAGDNGGHRFALFGRYTPPPGGDRVDHFMERYEATNKCFNNFLQRLAGPQVNPGPASNCHQKAPHTQPGTLVFPQHPFLRSPRDYFMED